MLNFDTSTYHFSDIDLAMAIKRLPVRDREMLILKLMGHNQNDIALVLNLTRSMISKRLTKITKTLSIFMK
jgi:DNA-directed RNA polymerase specialized sigma24 family protein